MKEADDNFQTGFSPFDETEYSNTLQSHDGKPSNSRMAAYLHESQGEENEEQKKEDVQYERLHAEISDGKKRVSWKGSSELITMREIEYDSASTTSHSTHEMQDLGGSTAVYIQYFLEWCMEELPAFADAG